jgi:hypothetical protein
MSVLSKPEKVAHEQEHASPRELASRDVARLIKESIVAEAEWGSDSKRAVAARAESDKKLRDVDYEVASEGVARGYNLEPHSLDDEAAAEASNGNTTQQG